jgi:hypothetical protein
VSACDIRPSDGDLGDAISNPVGEHEDFDIKGVAVDA